MATPSAAPIWNAVLLRPEASPDSCFGDARERGDRGGDEREADAGAEDERPKKMSPK